MVDFKQALHEVGEVVTHGLHGGAPPPAGAAGGLVLDRRAWAKQKHAVLYHLRKFAVARANAHVHRTAEA